MPKSSKPRLISQRMALVHALGHPDSPAPARSRGPAHGQAGASSVATIVVPPLAAPNPANAPTLTSGNGSDLIVNWLPPATDSTHGAATGFNLRSSPSGTG